MLPTSRTIPQPRITTNIAWVDPATTMEQAVSGYPGGLRSIPFTGSPDRFDNYTRLIPVRPITGEAADGLDKVAEGGVATLEGQVVHTQNPGPGTFFEATGIKPHS